MHLIYSLCVSQKQRLAQHAEGSLSPLSSSYYVVFQLQKIRVTSVSSCAACTRQRFSVFVHGHMEDTALDSRFLVLRFGRCTNIYPALTSQPQLHIYYPESVCWNYGCKKILIHLNIEVLCCAKLSVPNNTINFYLIIYKKRYIEDSD